MKFNFLLCSALSFVLFSQYSCSNEVEVIGIWKDIPVVYAVIRNEDSLSYISVQRAYLPPNQSALEVAQIPDSLYFDTSEVDVSLFKLDQGDTLPWPYPLEYVNLADEGVNRDSGIFAHDPAYAYKIRGNVNRTLFLKIDNQKTGNTFTATTESVRSTVSNLYTIPSYYYIPYKPIEWREINNQGEEVYASLIVDMTGNGFASIYDYKFRFHYKEYQVDLQGDPVVGTEVNKSIEWRAVSDFIPTAANLNKRTISGEAFYQFIASKLSDVSGTNTRRCAAHIEVYVDGGSASLRDYIKARQANEGFVAGLYPAEPYSNVTNGFGVFATAGRLERQDRSTDPRLMEMSSLTIQHMIEGDITKHLGFESSCY
ncbi:MAG: hypothetical protein MK207_03230 [Saprospiraceae bacterium]|nr:hypothetical protein [Saprospiraceae bacterium]